MKKRKPARGYERMFREPSFWFDVRVYLALTAILVVIIAFLEKWLALIGIL